MEQTTKLDKNKISILIYLLGLGGLMPEDNNKKTKIDGIVNGKGYQPSNYCRKSINI